MAGPAEIPTPSVFSPCDTCDHILQTELAGEELHARISFCSRGVDVSIAYSGHSRRGAEWCVYTLRSKAATSMVCGSATTTCAGSVPTSVFLLSLMASFTPLFSRVCGSAVVHLKRSGNEGGGAWGTSKRHREGHLLTAVKRC